MKRKRELIIIFIIFLFAGAWYLNTKGNSEMADVLSSATVYYNDKELLNIPLNKDAKYTVAGYLGDVVIEVNNKRIRVAEEISPLNYCSIQGWVSKTNVPIVCLPNKIMIIILCFHNFL